MSKILIEVTEAERDLGGDVAKALRMRSTTALAKHAFIEFISAHARKPAKRGTLIRKGSKV